MTNCRAGLAHVKSTQDVYIMKLHYRKWWNPMRYVKGKLIKNKCTGKFVPLPND